MFETSILSRDLRLPYLSVQGSDRNKHQPHMPWSHLTTDEFVMVKKAYTKYWYRHLKNHNQAKVFGQLIYHVNYQSGACFPSRARIAKQLYISEKTVQRAIKVLEGLDLIEVQRMGDLDPIGKGFLTVDSGRSNR